MSSISVDKVSRPRELVPNLNFNHFTLDRFEGDYNKYPVHWKSERRVDLDPADIIFKEVYDKFYASMHIVNTAYKLTRIEHICNTKFFNSYCCRKAEMNADLLHPREKECWLWHGCNAESVDSIVDNGFHSGYAIPKILEGKDVRNIPNMKADATINMWGIGSYFATKSYYSWNNLYSTPSKTGEKVILLNRVLVGTSCLGREFKRFPDNIPNSTTMCDSMTDNLSSPSLYVISSGGRQIYTEFVLHFHICD
jgi:hypothetical protein